MSELFWAANPYAVLRHFRRYRYLLLQMTRREVESRYRGSYLGLLWSLLTPLLMLGVYTFVFTVVFRHRWSNSAAEDRVGFALAIFAGLTVFTLFADTVGVAPRLILRNRNYVKRIVFPLEIVPVAGFLANLTQAVLSLTVFLIAVLLLTGGLCWTLVYLPLILIPLSLLCLGCAFFLSSLGAFIRDIDQAIGPLMRMMLFMSAVFYPLSALPASWRPYFYLNPLVSIIEDVRRVSLQGSPPNWPVWCAVSCFSAVLAVAGLTWFMKSKDAFADVL